jgi:hypothetical protein
MTTGDRQGSRTRPHVTLVGSFDETINEDFSPSLGCDKLATAALASSSNSQKLITWTNTVKLFVTIVVIREIVIPSASPMP